MATSSKAAKATVTYKSYSDRFVDPRWAPRWQQIFDWRKAHGGVSGGVNAKRRQGRGHAARRAA